MGLALDGTHNNNNNSMTQVQNIGGNLLMFAVVFLWLSVKECNCYTCEHHRQLGMAAEQFYDHVFASQYELENRR